MSIKTTAQAAIAAITDVITPAPKAPRAKRSTDKAASAKRITDMTNAHMEAEFPARATDKEVKAAKARAKKASTPKAPETPAPTKTEGEILNTPEFLANLDKDREARQEAMMGKQDAPKEAPPIPTTGYTGPMRALRDRVKAGAYKKAANGQPSCGDNVANILGQLEPKEVIQACLIAMAIENPYTHLNIGQQSMNLRNKLRGMMKRGEFGEGVLREAVEVVMEARPAPAPTKIKLTSATGVDDSAEQHHTDAE